MIAFPVLTFKSGSGFQFTWATGVNSLLTFCVAARLEMSSPTQAQPL